MSVDFKIDYTSGDMVINADGSIEEATNKDEVVQRIRTRIQKQYREWRYNLDSGIPWQATDVSDGLLGSRNASAIVRQFVVNTAIETDGVTGVNVVQVRFDTATREYTIQLNVDTVYGNATITL